MSPSNPAQAEPAAPPPVETDQAGRIVVLGIGNTLLSDEGLGVRIIEALHARADLDAGVDLVDGGTLSFTLAVEIEDAETLIVVDAAELKAEPGTVRVFEGTDMDEFLNGNRKRSVHEVGLMDLMDIARLYGGLPPRRALVAVQPQTVDWGESVTPAVSAALPCAVSEVVRLIERYQSSRKSEVESQRP